MKWQEVALYKTMAQTSVAVLYDAFDPPCGWGWGEVSP
jgi:hypothetical protein